MLTIMFEIRQRTPTPSHYTAYTYWERYWPLLCLQVNSWLAVVVT